MLRRRLCCLLLAGALPALADAPLGFGEICENGTDLYGALGGVPAFEADAGHSVYATGQALVDGEAWLEVNLPIGGVNATMWVPRARVLMHGDRLHGAIDAQPGDTFVAALFADGTVRVVGYDAGGTLDTGGWTDVVGIAAGTQTVLGLRADGTVLQAGEHAAGAAGWRDVRAIYMDGDFACAIQTDGTVLSEGKPTWRWGYGSRQPPTLREGHYIASAAQVDLGRMHVAGLMPDGTAFVLCQWPGDPMSWVEDWEGVIAISAGMEQTIGLMPDGTVLAAGQGDFGECEVDGWRDIVAISAGIAYTMGLRADGTVLAAGGNEFFPQDVSHWQGVVAIRAGARFAVGITSGGEVLVQGAFVYPTAEGQG